MLKRLYLFIAGFSLWVVFFLGISIPVSAQSNSQIVQGLCTGANLKFTENPTDSCNSGPSATDKINGLLRKIVNLLSALVGVVAVIMIIVGGFRYITSGGNDTSVTSAKNTILYAIIGLVIVALAQIIVRFVIDKIVNT